jgi:hypothetical protein
MKIIWLITAHNENFTHYFGWVRNRVSHITRKTHIQVFENRVLRRIFGSKREEVTGRWRKLFNAKLIICALHQILLG